MEAFDVGLIVGAGVTFFSFSVLLVGYSIVFSLVRSKHQSLEERVGELERATTFQCCATEAASALARAIQAQ